MRALAASSARWGFLSIVLLSGPAVLAGPPAQDAHSPRTPQFSTRSDLVSVDVTVFDERSEPITGLTAADFTVLVDGTPRPVVTVSSVGSAAGTPEPPGRAARPPDSSADTPARLPGRDRAPVSTWVRVVPVERRFVVVVDRENIRAGEGQEVLAAAARFVEGLPATDRVAVWSLPARTTKLSFAESREAMARRLGRMLGTYDVMVGGLAVAGPLGQAGEGRPAVLERAMRASDTINGLRDLVLTLQPLPGPKHIVLVTGGAWMDETNLVRVRELAALASASRTQFHAMHVRPLPAAAERADFANLPTACTDLTLLSTGALAYELAILTGGHADAPSPGLIQGAAFDRFARQVSAWVRAGVRASGGGS